MNACRWLWGCVLRCQVHNQRCCIHAQWSDALSVRTLSCFTLSKLVRNASAASCLLF